ncbi:MAG: sigma-54-dependent Fis family transcriptional regulator [Gammaproteobacteria bacterium]|nr:sigma-54-dependent Fis family transcriptional regulator [Gammaproteobacteria bacterium]NIR85362.1 sigma-54-dependent Fis family transcriptional regulator [Gammaproteobacteria bacterium]NIR88880.1 sigma-54-dependent Fis family transcriptional regulator [Gammaproteobacteria bacterium]NIU06488.1 sigma-54-dependent Fis family transcriptional regulator [Gammaproteobacteria bacterium]NIV53381.1 response regulator [Gammaproteobacteria bacterium]
MVSAAEKVAGRPSAAPADRALVHNASILIVDDEPGMRNFLRRALEKRCALLEVADSVETAEAIRQRCHFDLMIVDIRLPGRSGVEWLCELREREVRTDVIVMTAYADLDTAIAALRCGAADFILKPFRLEQMVSAVQRCLERRQIARENFLLRREMRARTLDGIIGNSSAMRNVCSIARRVAPTSATVLVEGETGTGKELVARAVHALSGRTGPFVPVNCGSIAPDLLESELFGHTKGAFTGAHQSREGLFMYAQGGTLFLDEIAEMPLPMQAKLLRAIEEKQIRAVGAEREMPIDVRVITATNRKLSTEMEQGRFREDLYFRLNVVTITVPPVRERLDDIPALAEYFSNTLSQELGVPALPFTHDDVVQLQTYPWPGNVRELKNVIERSLLLGKLPSDCFPGDGARRISASEGSPLQPPLAWTLAEVEKHHMLRILDAAAGNRSEAARRLGVSRKTLERKLKAWSRQDAG